MQIRIISGGQVNQDGTPLKVVTDKLKSYLAAKKRANSKC